MRTISEINEKPEIVGKSVLFGQAGQEISSDRAIKFSNTITNHDNRCGYSSQPVETERQVLESVLALNHSSSIAGFSFTTFFLFGPAFFGFLIVVAVRLPPFAAFNFAFSASSFAAACSSALNLRSFLASSWATLLSFSIVLTSCSAACCSLLAVNDGRGTLPFALDRLVWTSFQSRPGRVARIG